MTDDDYIELAKEVMKQLNIPYWEPKMKEIIAALPVEALEFVCDPATETKLDWEPRWLKLCKEELSERILLNRF